MKNITADDAMREVEHLLRAFHGGPDEPPEDGEGDDRGGDGGYQIALTAETRPLLLSLLAVILSVPFLFGWLVGKASR